MELLAWAWAMPAEKPSIWARRWLGCWLNSRHPEGSMGITSGSVPGPVSQETLAPGSECPDGVTTEPQKNVVRGTQVLGPHPGGHREAQKAPDPLPGKGFPLHQSQQRHLGTLPASFPLRESVLSMDLLGAAPGVKTWG